MSFGQTKNIRFKNEYTHPATKTVFPKLLFDYKLEEVTAFDKEKTNVCIQYKDQTANENTVIDIYIYPAFSGYDGRLREEYSNSLIAINYYSKQKREFNCQLVRIENDEFIVNGLKSTFITDEKNRSQLSIYECGTWFFKTRITSDILTLDQISDLEKEISLKYNPADLTKLKPLNLKGKVNYGKLAFKDTLLLASTMTSSFKKFEWAIHNVSEKEKKSGFPDLYLGMHVAAIKKFVDFEQEYKDSKEKKTLNIARVGVETGKYLDDLRLLINAGFLEEYIMENYDRIMIVPDDVVLDYEGFNIWKKTNTLPDFLFRKLYQDSYEDN